jgi:hypothetical protein
MAVLELVDYNLERDESAARSQSKKTITRAERVRRSQQKQGAKKGAASPVASDESEVGEGASTEEKRENVDSPKSAAKRKVAADQIDEIPEGEPVESAPGYGNQSLEVATGEDPAEPLARQQTADQIKKPAPKEGKTESDSDEG